MEFYSIILGFLLIFGGFIVLAFRRAPLWLWTIFTGLCSAALSIWPAVPTAISTLLWGIFILIFLPLNITYLRRRFISAPLLSFFRKFMPTVSKTEREALEAGTVWWDADLFSGRPDWAKLAKIPKPELSSAEQAFLDGPVQELCAKLNDWQITHGEMDLPSEVWDFLKKHKFFGMIIPKKYGGLEFSALAHSAVIVKLVSKGITPAVTAMVPNSLGPGQLLINYGTKQQKDYYLPRLATGEEIPCFALTSPQAGSDAAAMQDTGVVSLGEFAGKKDVLGIRLNWDKRYITLAPVATLLGLAFKLYDPDNLIGTEKTLGITLALIPTDLAGVETGLRHFPLNQPFMNGPTRGKDVFIPIEYIIGGQEYAGQGWRMLMDCLADGRAISLPSLAAGTGKLASRATGAYGRIRQQFKTPIGRFEGIEEAIARIGGNTYAIEAVRVMTAQAVDMGEKPSVVSAIAKYHSTERMRTVLNDAMDVFGGSAICLGPKNLLGRYYESIPISITVEGANILTRSLIIFGQGVIRSHPWLLAEMNAAGLDDKDEALRKFDPAFWGHVGFTISNFVRTFVLGISDGLLAQPAIIGRGKRYARQVTRFSAALALVADISLLVLGGSLKRKERISARLGDVLSQMYFVSAAIKRFNEQGKPKGDEVFLDWVCQDSLHIAQERMIEFLKNFPLRTLARLLRILIFPRGRTLHAPSDRLDHDIVQRLLGPSEARDRLTSGIFITSDPADPLGRLEDALTKVIAATDAEAKLKKAMKGAMISGSNEAEIISNAMLAGILNAEEAARLNAAADAVLQAIAVDEFGPEDL